MNREEYKREEMQFEARDMMWAEFDQTFTDFDIAKEMVDNEDEEMTFEEMREIMFDIYCSERCN